MPPCSIAGSYMVNPKGKRFFAYSNYFYAAYGVGLVGWSESKDLTWPELEAKGREFCAKNMSEALAMNDGSNYTSEYCFTNLFAAAMIESYGFSRDQNITFGRKLNGFSADWTLGAMLFESRALPLHASLFGTAFCSRAGSGDDDDDVDDDITNNDDGTSGDSEEIKHLKRQLMAVSATLSCILFLSLIANIALCLRRQPKGDERHLTGPGSTAQQEMVW